VQCNREPENIEQALKCGDSDKWTREKNEVKLDYIQSEELMADLLTKALSGPKLSIFAIS
jgi:hypothetical protein